jgi:hypothetical protein
MDKCLSMVPDFMQPLSHLLPNGTKKIFAERQPVLSNYEHFQLDSISRLLTLSFQYFDIVTIEIIHKKFEIMTWGSSLLENIIIFWKRSTFFEAVSCLELTCTILSVLFCLQHVQ